MRGKSTTTCNRLWNMELIMTQVLSIILTLGYLQKKESILINRCSDSVEKC
jgi:hypothetical protein